MSRRYEKTLKLTLLALGLLLLCVAFYQVWVRWYNPYIRLPFYRRGNYMFTLMYAAILVVCVLVLRGQELGEAHLTEIIVSQCIALTMTTVIVYFPMSLLQYELLRPWPLLLLMVGQWMLICVWNLIANRVYNRLVPAQRLLLVWDGKSGRKIAEKLNRYPNRFKVAGSVEVGEGKSEIRKQVKEYDGVLLSVQDDEWRSWVVRLCFKKDKRLFLAPTLTDVIVNQAKAMHPIDTPLLCSTDHRLTVEERALKRVMDVVVSALALAVLSPVFVLVAVWIKLDDGGPVFFRQERLTRDGEIFRICKFRSMVVDAGREGPRMATEHDERITRAGHFLRKTRLDELPQLLNVLKGDMSLVGPRPECQSIAKEYEKKLPEFAYRLKVKAGITGYAQVYGDYGTHPADKLMMDIMYIERSSIVVDISILLLTVRALFMTEKTRGKREHKCPAAEAEA